MRVNSLIFSIYFVLMVIYRLYALEFGTLACPNINLTENARELE